MSVPKKGKVFPKKGRVLHSQTESERYAVVIAAALRQDVGGTHRAIKTVVRWTGANERTVKYWLAGTSGPKGEHLVALAHHSDAVHEAFMRLAAREQAMAVGKVVDARNMLLQVMRYFSRPWNRGTVTQSEPTGWLLLGANEFPDHPQIVP